MSCEDMIEEFKGSIHDCERTMRATARKLSFLSAVDSLYLGHRYRDRIYELCEKLATVETEKDELIEAFRDIGPLGSGPCREDVRHGEAR